MWATEAAKLEAKKIISYRVDFWLYFVVNCSVEITLAYYLWNTLYELKPNQLYGGFSFHQMMSYYIYIPFIHRLVRANDDFTTSREIFDGTLTKYLIYPLSFISYKMMQRATYASVSLIQMLIALSIVQLFFDLNLTLQNLFLGLISCFFSFILYSLLLLTFEFAAFWFETVWYLGVILRFTTMFLGGAFIPLSLFPTWAQQIIHLTPFPYLYSLPIKTFLGNISYTEYLGGILMTLFWILPIYFCNQFVFKRGLKNYTGVGM